MFLNMAKLYITESELHDIIREAIGNAVARKQERMLAEQVESVVREQLNELFDQSQIGIVNDRPAAEQVPAPVGNDMDERKKHHKKFNKKKPGNLDSKKKDASFADKAGTKRAVVLRWLKKGTINNAEIMRKLWRPKTKKEEDSLRSLFYKKRDGDINPDSGAQYAFSGQDINRMYGLKSDL